jgi:hypothetical protein
MLTCATCVRPWSAILVPMAMLETASAESPSPSTDGRTAMSTLNVNPVSDENGTGSMPWIRTCAVSTDHTAASSVRRFSEYSGKGLSPSIIALDTPANVNSTVNVFGGRTSTCVSAATSAIRHTEIVSERRYMYSKGCVGRTANARTAGNRSISTTHSHSIAMVTILATKGAHPALSQCRTSTGSVFELLLVASGWLNYRFRCRPQCWLWLWRWLNTWVWVSTCGSRIAGVCHAHTLAVEMCPRIGTHTTVLRQACGISIWPERIESAV